MNPRGRGRRATRRVSSLKSSLTPLRDVSHSGRKSHAADATNDCSADVVVLSIVSPRYHMYGAHVDSLNVYLWNGKSSSIRLWDRKGTQGNQWNYGYVNINPTSSYQVRSQSNTTKAIQLSWSYENMYFIDRLRLRVFVGWTTRVTLHLMTSKSQTVPVPSSQVRSLLTDCSCFLESYVSESSSLSRFL